MLNKSLIALAISAAAVSGVANAASIAVTGGTTTKVSIEGNKKTGASKLQAAGLAGADIGAVVLDTGSDYIINDLVVFTVSGATFDKTVTSITATGTTATFTLVDYSDDNNVRFRVSGANHPNAENITLDNFVLKSGTPSAATKVKFASKAISVNPLIGNYDAATAVEAAEFVDQVKYTITKLDAEVSTGAGRAEFTTTGSTKADVLTIAAANASTVDTITYNKSTHVIKGNFSYLMDYDANKDGKLSTAEMATAVTVGGATAAVVSVNTALTEITVVDTGAVSASLTAQLNVKGNAASGSQIEAPQSFTLDTTITDGTNTTVQTQVAAGAFTLDGSTTNVAFLPYGANYAQSVTVTNRGTVEGAITVDVAANGEKHSKVLTAVSSAKSVTDISGEVKALVAEKFGADFEGNVSLSIVSNAPSIEATALYFAKSDADRVLVQSK
jgi:hypothetical protein